ncbi:MAG: uncharacterized protein KVP18_004451 [Porospora cf. gigantea A]|uniref:uncharacterized protein n=1 Tax=Porospora cf. gigantea A TaxID=2853593 RepID=UPI00355A3AAF|nr:MAG: hypothetical protein KVP18_004451 [Porospora cf. gigantea A]
MDGLESLFSQQEYQDLTVHFSGLAVSSENRSAFDEVVDDPVSFTVRCSRAASTDFDKTGLVVWPASERLARLLLEDYGHLLADKRVLELGCGAGLVALVASRFASSVMATDGDGQVVQMARGMPNKPPNLDFEVYEWGGFLGESFDVIVGADVAHWPHAVSGLITTIKSYLRPQGVCFLSGTNRGSNQLQFVRNSLTAAGLSLTPVASKSSSCDDYIWKVCHV